MNDDSQALLRFGAVEVHPAQRRVLLEGQPVPLGARAIDVLMTLVQHRDRVVTKEELLDTAWRGLVVEENNLQVQISTLRRLLGRETIATVPGRGYRFTAIEAQPSPAPRPAAEAAVPGRLPAAGAPLLGRDAEVAELAQAVRAHRVVSIVGPGGIGKTRLALAVARGVRESFELGAWLVDLASVSEPAQVLAAAAQALSISLPANRADAEALAAALQGRGMLLVLDNCEHLVEAVGKLAHTLVSHNAGLHVLATSQERLRLAEEQVFRIAPLALPAGPGLQAALRCGAVALFAERARSLNGGFVVDEGNVADVVEICRQLDGLPLAIELAAARTPLLGVAGVRARLDDRFRVLTAGTRTAAPRHRTLREMLDWSVALLDERERAVFVRAGVFAGSFSLEAAQQVLSDERIEPWEVLDLLGSLVDKSLVATEPGDPPRLRLLESMRAYAQQSARESGVAAALARRHARTQLELLSRWAAEEWTLSTQARLAQALPDLDNLRAALAWAAGLPDADELHIGLAGASAWLWLYTEMRVEGLRHLAAAMDRIGPSTDPSAEAWLLAGWVSLRFPAFGAPERAAMQRAMQLFRELGDRRGAYGACFWRVRAAASAHEIDALGPAVRELESLHDPSWPAISRWEIAIARYFECWFSGGELEPVIAGLEESLRLAEDFGDLNRRVRSMMYLEQTAEGLGRFDEAVMRGRELLDLLRSVPFSMMRAHVMGNLCLSLTRLGRLDEALDAGRDALAEHRRLDTVVFLLDSAALLALRLGRPADAARVLGRADAAVVANRAARQPNEVQARELVLAGLQAVIPADERESLMREGAALSDEVAASRALDAPA